MKVGIDTFGCEHGKSGIGSYLHSFSSHLPNVENVEFELFGSELDKYTYNSESGVPFKVAPVADNLHAERFWHFFKINDFVKEAGYDVVLFPAIDKVLPLSFSVPGIAIVNAIISNLLKNYDWTIRSRIKRGLKKADKIIVASNFLRKDLIRAGFDSKKIHIVHSGINHQIFFPQLQADAEVSAIKPFAIKTPYFIYGSRLSGFDKKHIELIKAFTLFKEKTHLPHRLVIAGQGGAVSGDVQKAASNSPFAEDIFLTGFFPHESFPQIYASASACVFPSVNEGVGLPILEAMATGIPVVCAKAGALQEMGGEAPIYFDADNIEEIAAALEKVVTDDSLRQKMILQGLRWAKRFNWDTTVMETINIMKEVVG